MHKLTSKNIYMKRGVFIVLLTLVSTGVFSYEKRDILQHESRAIGLTEVLVKDFSEIGLPTYNDRDFWNKLPLSIRQQYIEAAERYIDYGWPVVKATDYLEIIRSGDRRQEAYAAPSNAIQALVMGELVEGEGRFIDQIVNGVWYYSEQTWWGWSAHLTAQKAKDGLPDVNEPVIDLGVGEITNLLSWTWFLFKEEFDKIHPLISQRLKQEIMNKALIPYYERDDFWWMGFDSRPVNNWNPWTNHNMLTAILILEDDQQKKISNVEKVIRSLDSFVNIYPEDGGCDEGPSYWGRAGASLYQCLDLLWRATRGKFNVYDNPLIRNMGSYIYKAYIDYPYFINFADADATTSSRPAIIYRYGKDIGDVAMQQFGAFLARESDWGRKKPGEKIDEQIMQLIYLDEIANATARNALIGDFWLPDTEVGGGRDMKESSSGFFFAAKGGHNNESHNHNDIGSCLLYADGKPCLIDLGRETYTAKTFSSARYEIWTMQSQFHNLPRINGRDQLPGREFQARNSRFSANKNRIEFTTDIAAAYPEETGISSWERSYRLDRGRRFVVKDRYSFSRRPKNPTTLNFVTYCKVTARKPGRLTLQGDDFTVEMEYDQKKMGLEIECIPVADNGLKRYWPNGVTRIVLTLKNAELKGENSITIVKK